MRGRFLLASAAAAVVVMASPFVGRINTAVSQALPDQYVGILLASVILPGIAAIGLALLRIRERRLLRYSLLAVAVAIAGLYATVMETTRTEQFHFTEYGIVTFLFSAAWRSRNDAGAIVLPVCAALVAGFADEWFQWFVPSRVGEARDVVLNGVGIACGLLIAFALNPLPRVAAPAGPGARRVLAIGLTAVIVVAALFLQTVHLGYDVHDSPTGTFRSRFTPSGLREAAEARAARWRLAPPAEMPLVSREDHYLSEARFHVEFRNRAVSAGDSWSAWRENLILERLYAPVLESGLPGSRWPAGQRTAIAAVSAADARPYVSAAYPFPLYAWNRWLFWSGAAALVAIVWLLCR